MGTFGLGGLHRKSTWLYPVASVIDLPPTAVDGAVAIALDTNIPFQFDASLPGWIPLPGGAGTTTRTICWPCTEVWADIYADIVALDGCAVVLVEECGAARSIPAGTYDLSEVHFLGQAKSGKTAVTVELADGVRLTAPIVRSKDIQWESLETTGYIYSGSVDAYLEFDGGGWGALTGAGAHPHFSLSGTSNIIELRNSAVMDATGWSSTTEDSIILLPSGGVAKFLVTTDGKVGPNILTSPVVTVSTVSYDASSRIDSGLTNNSAGATLTLLDHGLYVFYDDTIVSPTLGSSTVQGAIDALKSQELREVLLTFSAAVATGTAINIQTGVYGGAGSPATVTNDTNVTLPTTGATFMGDARIEVLLNGQDLTKGDGTGTGEAEWVSTTQLKFNIKLKNNSEVMVRAPFPTA